MKLYSHTQPGKLIGWIMTAVMLLLVATIVGGRMWTLPAGVQIIPYLSLVLLVAAWVLFGSLTVEITPSRLIVKFGPGLIKKSFRLGEIQGAEAVRNKWWYGWGIRLTPNGWMYNVSGLDAVELKLTGDRKFRIGTDEPDRLLSAIRSATGR